MSLAEKMKRDVVRAVRKRYGALDNWELDECLSAYLDEACDRLARGFSRDLDAGRAILAMAESTGEAVSPDTLPDQIRALAKRVRELEEARR